jgi:uncharacterized protein (DUF779 family)
MGGRQAIVSEDSQGRHIEATAAASEALRRLQAEHGRIILHIPGGAEDAGSPVCLSEGELLLGPQDMLLGVVDGVRVYPMPSRPTGLEPGRRYVLDLIRAMPVGFSLRPGDGLAFRLREVLPVPPGAPTGPAFADGPTKNANV